MSEQPSSNVRVAYCDESNGWAVHRGDIHVATFQFEQDARDYALPVEPAAQSSNERLIDALVDAARDESTDYFAMSYALKCAETDRRRARTRDARAAVLAAMHADEPADAHAYATKNDLFNAGASQARYRYRYRDALMKISEGPPGTLPNDEVAAWAGQIASEAIDDDSPPEPPDASRESEYLDALREIAGYLGPLDSTAELMRQCAREALPSETKRALPLPVATFEGERLAGISCKNCGKAYVQHIVEDEHGRKNVCPPDETAVPQRDRGSCTCEGDLEGRHESHCAVYRIQENRNE